MFHSKTKDNIDLFLFNIESILTTWAFVIVLTSYVPSALLYKTTSGTQISDDGISTTSIPPYWLGIHVNL